MVSPSEVAHLYEINEIDWQTDLSARTDPKGFSGAVANRPAPAYPIIIAEWPRNSRQIVRVALDPYNNRETIDVRSWWQDGEGDWRPGRGGLTLAVKHLRALADGLADALDRARTLGLIEPATTNKKDRTAAERQRRYRARRNGMMT